MNINWFPGHMVTAKKEIQANLKLVDIVIEIVDARIPSSSRNPDLDEIVAAKPRIIALNKSDLSSQKGNTEWVKYYKSKGIAAMPIDSASGKGIKELIKKAFDMMSEKLEKSEAKGRIGRPVRAAVLGIPNAGKSSFINRVAGRNAAEVANRPGVTRRKQWVNAGNGVELLDTPGVLWPKFENEEVGLHLAYTGTIKNELVDITEVTIKLIEELVINYKNELTTRFKLDDIEGKTGLQILEMIGKKRGCVVSGGNIDLTKASLIVIDEFRSGKIGKITLEMPPK